MEALSNTYTLNYVPGPVAESFHMDIKSRVKLLIGPFGTGKTTSAAWDLVDFQSERVLPINGKKKTRFAVVRNTYPELRDTVIPTYLDWFPPELFNGSYNSSNKRLILKIEDKEIEILFKALDTPKDVRDLLSLELTGAHVEEAREIHQDVIKGLLGRIGRYPSRKDTQGKNPFTSPPQVTLTTNYPDDEHHLYRDFVDKPIDGYSIFEQKKEENLHNLRDGYYNDLEKDYADRPDLLKTLVRGEWGVTVHGKLVYPEYKRVLHVAKHKLDPIEGLVIRGWDNSGLSPAAVITQLGSTGQWLIHKEFCGEDIGILDFGEAVQVWCNNTFGGDAEYRDIGDPAGAFRDSNKMSPAAYLRKLGIKVEDGIQTFKSRREAVSGRLTKLINGEPAILINPQGCKRVIGGFEGGYAYPEIGNTGEFKKDPAKNKYSHPHDAIQYPATRLFIHEKPKKPVIKPQRRATPGGWMN